MGILDGARPIAFVLSRDVAALAGFYGDILGLPMVGQDPYGTTFALGGGATVRLTLIEGHVPGPHTVLGWAVDGLDATVDRLAAAGVAAEIFEGFGQDERGIWTSPDGSGRIVWFRDPEGNGLSLTEFA